MGDNHLPARVRSALIRFRSRWHPSPMLPRPGPPSLLPLSRRRPALAAVLLNTCMRCNTVQIKLTINDAAVWLEDTICSGMIFRDGAELDEEVDTTCMV